MHTFYLLLLPINCFLFLAYLFLRCRNGIKSIFLHEAVSIALTIYSLGTIFVFLSGGTSTNLKFLLFTQVTWSSSLFGLWLVYLSSPSRFSLPFTGSLIISSSLKGRERRVVMLIAMISGAVCALSFISVLLNEVLQSIFLSSLVGEENYLVFRKAVTTGSVTYLAPGYVKQFRDILLPAALASLILFDFRKSTVFLVSLTGIGVLSALVTGQRAPVLLFLVTVIISVILRRKSEGGMKARYWMFLGLSLFIPYLLLTVLLGRISVDASWVDHLLVTSGNFFERLVMIPPRENMAAFSLWQQWAPTYGTSWVRDLSLVLPGTQITLSSELHEALGGSTEGNSPLGMPADLFLAWGWIGCAVFPLVYVVILFVMDVNLRVWGSALGSGLRLVCLFSSITWVSPYLFLLNGGLVLLLLYVFRWSVRASSPEILARR